MTVPYAPVSLTLPSAPVTTPRSLEEWEGLLKGLGMHRVLGAQGQGLPNVTERLCDSRRYSTIQEANVQIWVSPEGLIGVLHFFQTAFSGWQQSTVILGGLEVLPHARQGDFPSGAMVLSNGQALRKIEWRNQTANGPLDDLCESLQLAASEGRLVPIQAWPEIQKKSAFSTFESLNRGISSWTNVALDWKSRPVFSKTTSIPAEIHVLAKRTLRKAFPDLSEALAIQLQKEPKFLHELFEQILKDHHDNLQTTLGKVTDKHKKKYWRQQVSSLARDHLDRLTPVVPYLSEEQGERVSSWVNNLARDTEDSVGAWARLPLRLPQVSGLSSLDLAFSVARKTKLNTAWDKVLRTVETCPESTLKKLALGQEGRYPLAMSIAKTLLNVPNLGVDLDRIKQANEKAFAALDRLVDRLGPNALVWSTPTTNVWGWALGWDLNLPIDQDLRQVHNHQMAAFLEWAERRGVDLPSVVRFQTRDDYRHHRSSFVECDQNDKERFLETWDKAARVASVQSGEEHWDLLTPLRTRLLNRHLSETLPAPARTAKPRF